MSAKSGRQRRAAGMALAAKRGKIPMRRLRGVAKQMAKMSEQDLRDFARKSKRKKKRH